MCHLVFMVILANRLWTVFNVQIIGLLYLVKLVFKVILSIRFVIISVQCCILRLWPAYFFLGALPYRRNCSKFPRLVRLPSPQLLLLLMSALWVFSWLTYWSIFYLISLCPSVTSQLFHPRRKTYVSPVIAFLFLYTPVRTAVKRPSGI